MRAAICIVVAFLCITVNAVASERAGETLGRLDASRLAGSATEPQNWFTPGRDAAGTYYSPLKQINAANVADLGFAWDYALGTTRGIEATPIVIDGVLFTSSTWGRVYALDARDGKELWTYMPDVDGQWGRYPCCDIVNRGVAVWQGAVYVGALDGWLHAVDATTGKLRWKVDTLIGRDRHTPYTITGAPLIAGNVVVIGNSGADFGVRGYVTAYDLETGAQKWRFFTVPHDPALGPQEGAHLERAVGTWDPKSQWQFGGGGTVWDGMAYDADAKLVYIGTGNSSPYDWKARSPSGGDNLYLVSIVAIHADNGEMAWYYQQVPGERWDYTATAKMILADVSIEGRKRQVLMQAPKDGYFYVLDRLTGEVISSKNYVFVNWAKGIDAETHRPIIDETLDYKVGPALIAPGMAGGHNWPPMSMSAETGLVYIPAIEMPMVYVDTTHRRAGLQEGWFTTPALAIEAYDPAALTLYAPLPPLADLTRGKAPAKSRAMIRAWHPIEQRVVWEQPTYAELSSGVMSSAGNLVFQGDSKGVLNVYAADSGALLKHIETGTSIMAAPMTYALGGVQYVAVMAGLGGGGTGVFGPDTAAFKYGNAGRLIVFKLGGGAVPLPSPVSDPPFPEPPARIGNADATAQGEVLFARYCMRCHAFARSAIPDLRRASATTHSIFYDIVLNGAYVGKGMGRFDDVLSREDAEAIRAYVIDQAWAAYKTQDR